MSASGAPEWMTAEHSMGVCFVVCCQRRGGALRRLSDGIGSILLRLWAAVVRYTNLCLPSLSIPCGRRSNSSC